MRGTHALRTAGVALLSLAAVACDSGTAPPISESMDTDAAIADFAALDSVFGSADWAGFQALGGRTPFASSAASLEVVGGVAIADSDGVHGWASALTRRLAEVDVGASGGPAGSPIISEWHRGATFVYDPSTDRYVHDPSREGAPATGVRLIVYAVDAAGFPILGQERGFADLVDEGDGSAEDIALRLRVVIADETVLDYRTTLDQNQDGGALTVSGFLADDGVRLDFEIAAAAREVAGVVSLDVDFDIGIEARGFSVVGAVRGASEHGESGRGSVDVTVRHRRDTVRLEATGIDGVLQGAVYLDGRLFATLSGSEDDLVFVGADGDPLGPLEIIVLARVADVMEDVFDFLEDLVDPVDEIVLLGVIL